MFLRALTHKEYQYHPSLWPNYVIVDNFVVSNRPKAIRGIQSGFCGMIASKQTTSDSSLLRDLVAGSSIYLLLVCGKPASNFAGLRSAICGNMEAFSLRDIEVKFALNWCVKCPRELHFANS